MTSLDRPLVLFSVDCCSDLCCDLQVDFGNTPITCNTTAPGTAAAAAEGTAPDGAAAAEGDTTAPDTAAPAESDTDGDAAPADATPAADAAATTAPREASACMHSAVGAAAAIGALGMALL